MPPIVDTEFVGSAGTLISAGLMTAGHYLQSEVLRIMDEALGGSLAFLLMMICAVMALSTIVFSGKYRYTLWFFIGPVLFFSATAHRVGSDGVEWKFGDRVHEQRYVKESVQGVYKSIDQGSIGKVSWFFGLWDRLTAQITNGVISFLNLERLKSDLDFISKMDRFNSVFQIRAEDGEMARFIHTVAIDKCSDYYALQQAKYDTARLLPIADFDTRLAAISQKTVVFSTDAGGQMLAKLWTDGMFGATPPPLKADGYNCAELWNFALAGAKQLANSAIVNVANANRPKEEGNGNELLVTDTLVDLARKFCANSSSTQCTSEGMVNLINAISVQIIQKAVRERVPGFAEAAHRWNITDPDQFQLTGESRKDETAEDIRIFLGLEEYRGKGEFLSLILALPYLQGLGFFFLTIGYPLAAFALLIPGGGKYFLHWMSLWFWIRSWDVGFALVMMIDEVLFILMPNGPPMTDAMLGDPGQAFKLMLSRDPTYSAGIYYMIMATLIGAVPVLTGWVFKRGHGEFQKLMGKGLKDFSGRIGGSVESFMGSFKAYELAGEAERDKVGVVDEAISRAIYSPAFHNAIGSVMSAKIMGELAGGSPANIVSTVSKGLSGSYGSWATRILKQTISAEANYLAYEAGLKEPNLRRAEQAMYVGWFTNNLTDSYPMAALGDLMAVRADLRLDGVVDSTLRNSVMKSIGAPAKSMQKSAQRATATATGGRP